jgi:hypothetical protein
MEDAIAAIFGEPRPVSFIGAERRGRKPENGFGRVVPPIFVLRQPSRCFSADPSVCRGCRSARQRWPSPGQDSDTRRSQHRASTRILDPLAFWSAPSCVGKTIEPSLKAVAFSGTDKRSGRTAWRARHCRDRISRSSAPWLLGLENRNFLHRTCRGALATLGAADASPATPARRGPCVKRSAHIPALRPRSKPAATCRTSSETPSGCRSPES